MDYHSFNNLHAPAHAHAHAHSPILTLDTRVAALFEKLKGVLSGPQLAAAASKCKDLVNELAGNVDDAELLARAGAVCANVVDTASEVAGPVAAAVSDVMKDVPGYSTAAMKVAVDAVPDDLKEKVLDLY